MNKEEEYNQQKLAEVEARYKAARMLAIRYQEAAARLMEQLPSRICRRVLKQTAGRDLYEDLRPVVTEEAAQLTCHIDSAIVRRGRLVIRGWAYDAHGIHPELLLREGRRILPAETLWYPRQDITELFSADTDQMTGFTVRVALTAIKGTALILDVENEIGVVCLPIAAEADGWKSESAYTEPVAAADSAGYDDWIRGQLADAGELEKERTAVFDTMPLISICIPLYRTKAEFLRELMDSLLGQSYERLEICLADGSDDMSVETVIQSEYAKDPRVRYQHLTENRGIAENTNAAFAMAAGDWVMLADHDDVLEKNACFEIVKRINEQPKADVIYTDEDKLMLTGGVYFSPNFKPDFNPDLLRTNNYITHIFCLRRELLEKIGGEKSEYDGAQDYDLILRAVEAAREVAHIPKVLYHWRAHPDSTAGNPESKLYAYENGRRAIEAHVRRLGIKAGVRCAAEIGSYRIDYAVSGTPKVSIIVPNKDQKDVLRRAVESIRTKTTWQNYELLIVENNSETEEIFDYYRELEADPRIRILRWSGAFNYSAVNNFAAAKADGEYLLFLNNDVEVITERWIEELLGYCQRSDVGAVGARLYYPNDTLQHCGLVVGIGGTAGHLLMGEPRRSGGYFGRIVKSQDVSAVTAACMMTKRSLFEEVGGFSEEFAVAYNDVDYCLKLRSSGYLVVYNAWAELYHYESLTRGSDAKAEDPKKHERQIREGQLFRKRWPEILKNGDPYFNPNLDYNSSEFALAGTVPEKDRNHDYDQ